MARLVQRVEEQAREALPAEVYRYFAQGAADGVSADEAETAWERFRFLPRVLMDVTEVDTTRTLLGTDVRLPVGVAPSTLQRAAHERGEMAMAEGARDAGALTVVTSNAGLPFAEIGATGAPWWLQMYVTADRAATAPVVQRALDAGARAIVLTADTPVVGTKYHEERPVWDVIDPGWLRVNFTDPDADPAGLEKAKDLGPQDIAWLANRFGVPVVVKGVLHPADARRCVEAGAAAVWVSNHGGRQLDRAVPTAEALGAVAAEVGGEVEVYADGGVRSGAHVLAATALGARAVFLGRPALYALAAGGATGVQELLEGLGAELVEALRLSGCASLSVVGRELVRGPAGGRSDRAAVDPAQAPAEGAPGSSRAV